MGGFGLLSSSLPFRAGCEDHPLPAKGEKHEQSFWFFLPFSDLFYSIFFFWFVVLPFFRWQIYLLLLPFHPTLAVTCKTRKGNTRNN
jgi:hypothetical protein